MIGLYNYRTLTFLLPLLSTCFDAEVNEDEDEDEDEEEEEERLHEMKVNQRS